MRKLGYIVKAASAVIAATAIMSFTAEPSLASSSDTIINPLKTSMVKNSPDYSTVMNHMGQFRWIVCGITAGPCIPGQVPIYTDYFAFRYVMRHGGPRNGSKTVMLDLETWAYTPLGQRTFAEAMWFTELAAQLIRRHPGYTLIQTPGGKRTTLQLTALVTQAARYGTQIVELQSQYATGNLAAFQSVVSGAIASVKATGKHPVFLAGIAPDAGGIPVTAQNMFDAWQWSYPLVSGWWVNAHPWPPPRGHGCATTGCPKVVQGFLQMIGA